MTCNADKRRERSKKRRGNWAHRLSSPRTLRTLLLLGRLIVPLVRALIELANWFRG